MLMGETSVPGGMSAMSLLINKDGADAGVERYAPPSGKKLYWTTLKK